MICNTRLCRRTVVPCKQNVLYLFCLCVCCFFLSYTCDAFHVCLLLLLLLFWFCDAFVQLNILASSKLLEMTFATWYVYTFIVSGLPWIYWFIFTQKFVYFCILNGIPKLREAVPSAPTPKYAHYEIEYAELLPQNRWNVVSMCELVFFFWFFRSFASFHK